MQVGGQLAAAEPLPAFFHAEAVFPPHPLHNHAPGIVECPNSDLLVSWYRGSGERTADDVAIFGSRLLKGTRHWSEPFLMADHPHFPDCNTTMMVDRQERLWLFWPIILANSWESCLTQFKVSRSFSGEGAPLWEREGTIFLKPDDFREPATKILDEMVNSHRTKIDDRLARGIEVVKQRLGEKLYQRLGWQPRCKPTILPTGRILLPLYSDTFSCSLMAISDDDGQSWYSSKPLLGFGNIQPSVLRRNDGTLVAYMRENGPTQRIRVCESTDDGLHWGPVGNSELPNPGSGLDGVRLSSGHWVLVYNDTITGRNQLAVSISEDEGRTWKWTRHLEKKDKGSFHYPAIIQGRDGLIHVVYSHFQEEGKCIKHAVFNVPWVQVVDG